MSTRTYKSRDFRRHDPSYGQLRRVCISGHSEWFWIEKVVTSNCLANLALYVALSPIAIHDRPGGYNNQECPRRHSPHRSALAANESTD